MKSIKNRKNKPKPIYITPTLILDDQPMIDPVSFTEYLRRKNELRQKQNPLASTLYAHALALAVNRGFIKIFISGDRKFIDWVKYKDYIFFTAGKTDKRKKKGFDSEVKIC